MNILEIIFWGSLGLVGYTYVGYPVLIGLFSRFWGNPATNVPTESNANDDGTSDWPLVSLIIIAHRAEKVILERLDNAMRLDYPADRLEVIVGCASDLDLTGDLVQTFNDSRVHLVQSRAPLKSGTLLKECVASANGEIVVLSTAQAMLDRDAVRCLVRHFHHADITAVCGQLLQIDPATGQEVGRLHRCFDSFLKNCESYLSAFIGCENTIFAVRREQLETITNHQKTSSDARFALKLYNRGDRLVFDGDAVARQTVDSVVRVENESRRFNRQALLWPMMNPRYGRVAFVFWSRRLLRWLAPIFLIAAMVSNVFLAGDSFYLQILLVQELFYLVVTGGMLIFNGSLRCRAFRVPMAIVGTAASFWTKTFRRTSETVDAKRTGHRQSNQTNRANKAK